jgi:hypothetical protein
MSLFLSVSMSPSVTVPVHVSVRVCACPCICPCLSVSVPVHVSVRVCACPCLCPRLCSCPCRQLLLLGKWRCKQKKIQISVVIRADCHASPIGPELKYTKISWSLAKTSKNVICHSPSPIPNDGDIVDTLVFAGHYLLNQSTNSGWCNFRQNKYYLNWRFLVADYSYMMRGLICKGIV